MNPLKREIEQRIAQAERTIEKYKKSLEIIENAEQPTWTHGVYKKLVKDLESVGICVLHRSSVFAAMDFMEMVDVDYLPDSWDEELEDERTKSDHRKLLKALHFSLKGELPEWMM